MNALTSISQFQKSVNSPAFLCKKLAVMYLSVLYIGAMKIFLSLILPAAVCALQPLAAQNELLPEADVQAELAAEEEEMNAAERALRDAIHARGQELVDLLRKVQDAASAKKHAARIRELLLWEPDAADLELVDEELLAVEFMESFEAIAEELSRLAEVQFYGEDSLQELMQYFDAELEEETP